MSQYPTPDTYEGLADPLLPAQLNTVHIHGNLNKPDAYKARALFPVLDTGDRYSSSGQGVGNQFSVQRLDVTAAELDPGDLRRAPGADMKVGTGFKLNPLTSACYEHSFAENVDLVVGQRLKNLNDLAIASFLNIIKLDLEEEFAFRNLLSTAANWHPDGGNVAVGWNQAAGKPVQDIADAARTVSADTLFLGEDAYWDFIWNQNKDSARATDKDRNGDDEAGLLAILAKFKIRRLIVGNARYNTSPGVSANIHQDYAWVGITEGMTQTAGRGEFQISSQAGVTAVERMPPSAPAGDYVYFGGTLIEVKDGGALKRNKVTTAGRSYITLVANRYAGITLGNTRT